MSQISELKKSDTKRDGKKTQDDIVYAHIFDAILEQRLSPGTKLNEESLGEIFGVSRTIIRRALSRLGYEQVVVLRPNRGAVVACPTIEEARQIVFARRVVEKAVMELVCDNAQKKQLEQLRQMVRDEQACFDRGDRGAGIRLSGEFHLLLAEIANNPPLLSFQRSLVSLCSLIIAQYESGAKSHCSYDEHFELIDAIAGKDKPRAVSLMMHHLDHIEEKLSLDDEIATDDLKAIFSHVRNPR
ncbi:DNA-binding transcriptional regulator, GntR family [Amphritea atlantica]|jgi:DNA-binding GntR family transcriptional regulator|uniref:DNA-binding transcriptional regulator, GntR family n=1 Tax=Amphritea atlantica TaxID=355243 RepID=A0A1H9CQC9_9GAMM|nr:GntR family transcriptional regulator [Amphritea atlantica]SEQ03422.1 DNA-binding transcriptional regulator, GntR family [Amphritea atlantica]